MDQSHLNDTWQAISRGYTRARNAIEVALKAEKLPGLDVLDALSALAASDEDLTAKALEHALLMPQYGVSRLLDRTEKHGLVARVDHPTDQRAKILKITNTGRETESRMRAVRDQALAEFLEPRARPGQQARVTRLMGLLDQDAERAD